MNKSEVVFALRVVVVVVGVGARSARTRDPAAARLKSLVTHAVFGVGLYLSARELGWLVRLAA